MKKIFTLILLSGFFASNAQTTQTFSYTGSVQTFTVPACVTSITVDVIGAQGGGGNNGSLGNNGGLGGRVQGTVPVTPGDILYIYVGGKGTDAQAGGIPGTSGYNGGGNGAGIWSQYAGGGGGGGSDVRLNGTTLNNRIVVGGGGGGGSYDCTFPQDRGGNGGGLVGENGYHCVNPPPTGGTQSAGGNGEIYPGYGSGTNGAFGVGGNGGNPSAGGGGGGGWYGGGGGSWGGGGGGSSYTSGSFTGVTHTQGYQTGNGQIVITYTTSGSVPSAAGPITGPNSVCQGSTATYSISSVSGATGYNWTVPTGATINSGQNTTSINVTFGTTSGSVTVTPNNSCGNGTPASLAITVNPIPVVSAGTNQSVCANTSCVQLNGTSSTGSGAWSTSGTGTFAPNNTTLNACYSLSPADIAAGTVSLTLTSTNNGGCNAVSQTIIITINTPPTVNLGNDITQCGGTVTLDAQNPGSTYLWSNSATTQTIAVSSSGTYSVTVTDGNGCTGTDAIVVTINALPTVTYVQTPTFMCINWPAQTLSPGSPTGGTYSGTAVTGNMFDPNAAGQGTFTITYTYTDVNGCTDSVQQTITVDLCTGIQNGSDAQHVNIYPNPSSGTVNINLNTGEIRIFNSLGEEVFCRKVPGPSELRIDLAEGIYYVQVNSGNGVTTEKLVIQK